MKLLIISQGYRSEDNNGFLHSRVQNYMLKDYEVEVLVYERLLEEPTYYEYEGVKVKLVNEAELAKDVKKDNYDIILIHFAFKKITSIVLENKKPEKKVIIWVHGYEALSSKRRDFNFKLKNVETIQEIKYELIYRTTNIMQLRFFRYLIDNQTDLNIHLVFVSNWMKKVTEKDSNAKSNIRDYSIIPNPIDTKIFNHNIKLKEDRLRIFNLRPYKGSYKYANDITVRVIKELKKSLFFTIRI